ncbi:MAG: alpha/beta hydrolase [Pseudomonadota bacterium]
MSETILLPKPAGRGTHPYARTPDGIPECSYFVHRPQGEHDRSRLLVAVHGITRNALEHAMVFRRWSERLGVAVVAPLFPRAGYRRYQTLEGRRGIPAADEAFDRIVEDACRHLGMDAPALHLFGYSGGGQFAHRYAFRHPRAVSRMVVGAAGWYTFPDDDLAYPLGLGARGATSAFAHADVVARYPPTLVVVGSHDRMRDESLNQDPDIDLRQGLHRRARARRWVDAMAGAARRAGCASPCRLHVLRGASHAFGPSVRSHALDRIVVGFLFPDADLGAGDAPCAEDALLPRSPGASK